MKDSELLSLCNERLSYNPTTGLFIWKVRRGRAFIGNKAGAIHHGGYLHIIINKKTYQAHRLAYLITYGYTPKYIDHINRDELDNRISNLRECTNSQNSINQSMPSNNTSGYKGVWRQTPLGRWTGAVGFNNKKIGIGSFDCKHEAALAYNRIALKYHGKFAWLNTIKKAIK